MDNIKISSAILRYPNSFLNYKGTSIWLLCFFQCANKKSADWYYCFSIFLALKGKEHLWVPFSEGRYGTAKHINKNHRGKTRRLSKDASCVQESCMKLALIKWCWKITIWMLSLSLLDLFRVQHLLQGQTLQKQSKAHRNTSPPKRQGQLRWKQLQRTSLLILPVWIFVLLPKLALFCSLATLGREDSIWFSLPKLAGKKPCHGRFRRCHWRQCHWLALTMWQQHQRYRSQMRKYFAVVGWRHLKGSKNNSGEMRKIHGQYISGLYKSGIYCQLGDYMEPNHIY